MTELDSDTWVGEVKRIRGMKEPLSSAGFHALRDEYALTIEPFRATLGLVWRHHGHTLDMSWHHRTPSNPRFRSARLIQTTFLRHFRGGAIQVGSADLWSGPEP